MSNESIIINDDLRTMQIPSSIVLLGVESDDDVNRIPFQMPKEYCGFDLSTFAARINYMNANGLGDVYVVDDVEIDGDDPSLMNFTWLVGRNACAYKGNTKFIVCLKKFDANQNVIQEFNTTVYSLPVLEGLETTQAVVQQNADIIEYILHAIEDAGSIDLSNYYTKAEVDALKLPNPYKLNINGTEYDGSAEVDISIDGGSTSTATASGSIIHLDDAVAGSELKSLVLQNTNGEAISSGNVVITNKNLFRLDQIAAQTVSKGITFVKNADGSIQVSGTSTGTYAAAQCTLDKNAFQVGETYTISSGKTKGVLYVQLILNYTDNTTDYLVSSNSPHTFTLAKDVASASASVQLTNSGVTVNNEVILPMIEVSDVASSFMANTYESITYDGSIMPVLPDPVCNIWSNNDLVNNIVIAYAQDAVMAQLAEFQNVIDNFATHDGELSETSENAVQNKIVTAALNAKADASDVYTKQEVDAHVGSPLMASTAAQMSDNDKIYVYTGSESGYTAGHWYYWNGSAWSDGGVYNSVALETDKTLSVADMAADAEITGEKLNALMELHTNEDLVSADNFMIGYVGSNGVENLKQTDYEMMSDFIEVEANTKYTVCQWVTVTRSGSWYRIAWYDSNKAFISASNKGVGGLVYRELYDTVTSPNNAAYARLSFRSFMDGVMSFYKGEITKAVKPTWYTNKHVYHLTDAYNVKSVAHRGYIDAPENTLPAYIEAKQHGFKFVECDVDFTSDNVPVLLHDGTIDRTSDGTGSIHSMTYAEALQYDFGSWKSAEYAGTKIPTFEEFISLCYDLNLYPYVDINTDDYVRDNLDVIVDIVKAHDMLERTTFVSSTRYVISKLKTIAPTAKIGVLTATASVDWNVINRVLHQMQSTQNSVFLMSWLKWIDPTASSYVDGWQTIIDDGFQIDVCTIREEAKYDVNKSVSGYITEVASFDEYMANKYDL